MPKTGLTLIAKKREQSSAKVLTKEPLGLLFGALLPNKTPNDQRPPIVRLKLSRFRRNFNKDLPIEFTEQNLSSFGGLELFSRYLRRVELSRRVGKACRGKGIRSDYGSVRLVLVLVGML